MKKIFFVLILLVLSLIILNVGYAECQCNTYCEGALSCYVGCTSAPMSCPTPCPFFYCPLQDLSGDCIDPVTNLFLTDNGGVCDTELETIIADSSDECKQTIKGNVTSNTGIDLIGYNVLTQFSPLFTGVDLSPYYDSYLTNVSDSNFSLTIPRSDKSVYDVNLIVTKRKYDADVKTVTIRNNTQGIIEKNFTLISGSCNQDCTDSFNRCNPECEGFIDENGNECSFYSYAPDYPVELVMEKCAYKMKGTTVVLNVTEDEYVVVECCEGGTIVQGDPPQIIPRPNANINIDNKDVVAIEKPVKLSNGEAGILKFIVWNN
jgi:hypothetical protein